MELIEAGVLPPLASLLESVQGNEGEDATKIVRELCSGLAQYRRAE
jgi:hypothetical protein